MPDFEEHPLDEHERPAAPLREPPEVVRATALLDVAGAPGVLTPPAILSLQRTAGNAKVARLLAAGAGDPSDGDEHDVGRRVWSGRRPLQRFEAPVHEAAERQGLTSDASGARSADGLTNEEASAVYMGNWMRD